MRDNIRNFAIIAHIDHGKSTLADRLIEMTGTLSSREMKEQILDSMDLERERGITIKSQTVRLNYKAKDGKDYILNLIDTPGHVDFSYEVSRALAACEGCLLVVDASQGVEAQTLANVYLALENDLEIVPVLNKVDLPAANVARVKEQIENVVGLPCDNAIEISAKSGMGIDKVLEAIVERLPPPKESGVKETRALLIDSWYNSYLGVMLLVRVFDGKLAIGQKFRLMETGASHDIERLGVMKPKLVDVKELSAGEVGVIISGIKQISDCKVGDTVTDDRKPATTALPGFRPSEPVVFCGIFPADPSDYNELRDSMEKLSLNDASFQFEPETSAALGFGFRSGFLGLLHLEIIQERLRREFNMDIISTAPSVIYKLALTDGTEKELHNPADMPEPHLITAIKEPWIKATILVPDEYLGGVLSLCTERRGVQKNLTYVGTRAMLIYELPLNETVFDFHDRLKSISRGYASFDYELIDYKESDLVKVMILINAEPVDALAMILHRASAETRGRAICEKLKEVIPRQLFQVPLQAAIGGRIIARETIPAVRKDVLAKCYGGDVSRKKKLLEKQKEGKKRLRQFGKVEIPHSAFLEVLKRD
ncbi:MAG: translation elongation factor 4 [Hydrotalea sp.]|nr:translation elongation factor 4 [Hydrotalea sp.]